MSRVANGRLQAITMLSWCLVLWAGCCLTALALPQTDNQTAIRRLAEAYFAAYQREDLEGMMSLWSAKSPDVAAARQSFQQTFADTDKIAAHIIKLGKAAFEADKARIRIEVEMSGVEAKTNRPAASFGRRHLTLEVVREGDGWKILRSAASEEELAAALAAAMTEEERKALLAAEQELVTVELYESLVRQGQSLSGQSRYAQSVMIYYLALQIAEQLGDKTRMAEAAQRIGHVYAFQGNYAQAWEYYRKSLALAMEVGDKVLIAKGLGSIAHVHSLQENLAQALEYYQKCLTLAEEAGDKPTVARALNNIGNLYATQGNHVQALKYHQQSLSLAQLMGDKGGIVATLNNIASLYELQGNYAQALKYYQQSLTLAEEIGDEVLLSGVLSNVGVIHTYQGDYARALEYHRKSLTLGEKTGDARGMSITLGNIGDVYLSQGDYARALEYHRKSLTLSEELDDRGGMSVSLNSIGRVYDLQGRYAQAVEAAERAASLAGQTGYLEGLWRALTTAGKAYRALGRPERARQAFADAISTIEKLRGQVVGGEQDQQRFFENKLAPYSQMVALLIAQDRPAEALAYAERAKGRVLLDVLRNGRANITKAMTRAEQEQELRLNAELIALNTRLSWQKLQGNPDGALLADLNSRLERARLAYESFQTSLYAVHPELKVQRGETPPLSLNETAQLLPADGQTALVEYVITEDQPFLFVLTKAAQASKRETADVILKVYPVNIKSKELSELVETFRQRLGERNLALNALAQRLYELLLKPAEAQLRGAQTLCIVPDGALWQLPFQALKPTTRRYLIEDQAIFYAPSLTTLREMSKPGKSSSEGSGGVFAPIRAGSRNGSRQPTRPVAEPSPLQTLLAVGNPLLNPQTVARHQAVYLDEELGALPEAEREVNALRELYGEAHSRIYIGAAARELRVKAEIGNYRIVHFATHGILDNGNPLYSHLLLAQETNGSGEDGLLEAREIMEMDLQAELVVLSACQTASGRVGAGEGVIGMTWALFVAGSSTTLVSQWKVDTRSTSKLIVEFHRNLQRQRQRSAFIKKAEALRQAMLTLLRSEEYELPYYWAPFVLVGDGF